MSQYDIAIIGGGPAGLAAALEVHRNGHRPLIIEREEKAGGILKQCIHEGFGLHRFKERLTGPEYTERFLKEVLEARIDIFTSTFVSSIEKQEDDFVLKLVNQEEGVFYHEVRALILANGCRERTSKQVFIHGNRPAGVYTAGTAQYYVNILGCLPCKKCVILGSGDIGLIMARRITLEGSEVVGVYEIKDSPSGLTRNVVQCLDDFQIPLHLSKTILSIHGEDRVNGVTICDVDENLKPLLDTKKYVPCDGVILSVGLIPENELATSLNILLDPHTKGPTVDQNLMTNQDGIFSCGNALHVNDLVDYVSESAETAAKSACDYVNNSLDHVRNLLPVRFRDEEFLYIVPQSVDRSSMDEAIFYFRSRIQRHQTKLIVRLGEEIILIKKYKMLKPPEMERIQLKIQLERQDTRELSFELVGDDE
ncbi:NAD(P)/FAD-dependent oxidoreductase [Vallitalea okinawensis]|uniref:NAD(P)/FAD-dependent oxidoreductase n=1 Tax=Vallitalea okinawensis TaxID=2078660 RepID=UPI000CFB2B72|nr:FAD-dependent oxidoreductase [Vallitalea okinawensis]